MARGSRRHLNTEEENEEARRLFFAEPAMGADGEAAAADGLVDGEDIEAHLKLVERRCLMRQISEVAASAMACTVESFLPRARLTNLSRAPALGVPWELDPFATAPACGIGRPHSPPRLVFSTTNTARAF